MTGSDYIIVILERGDEAEARSIRTNWDDRIIPKVGELIDMFWAGDTPGGWNNGVYRVGQVRAGVLDADPKSPRSQPAQLTVEVVLDTPG
jgi:hypothetical protein